MNSEGSASDAANLCLRPELCSGQNLLPTGWIFDEPPLSLAGLAYMGPREGSVGFLWLSADFENPRWREALVVGINGDWVQTLVKASPQEVRDSGLTHCTVEDQCFCLVEARAAQVRLGPTASEENTLKLLVDRKLLLKAGQDLLVSDEDLAYATASEPPGMGRGRPKSRLRGSKSPPASSSSSESEPNAETLLEKMRKSWLGEGSNSEDSRKPNDKPKEKSKSKRFSLLEKGKEKKSRSPAGLKASDMMKLVAGTQDPLHGLLALQIAQNFSKNKKKGKKHRKSRSSSSSRSGTRSSSSSSSTHSTRSHAKGHAKAVMNLQTSKRRMFKRPLKYVRRYVRNIEKEMGAQDKPFRVVDYTRRINFGKQRNLQRCHHLFGIVLEFMLKEEYDKAALQITLCLQALHQAAIDSDWTVAWLLTQTPDPYERKQFGGDPESLQNVTAYIRSMQELTKSSEALRRKSAGKNDEDQEEDKTRVKPKGRGKNKSKDQKESERPEA